MEVLRQGIPQLPSSTDPLPEEIKYSCPITIPENAPVWVKKAVAAKQLHQLEEDILHARAQARSIDTDYFSPDELQAKITRYTEILSDIREDEVQAPIVGAAADPE